MRRRSLLLDGQDGNAQRGPAIDEDPKPIGAIDASDKAGGATIDVEVGELNAPGIQLVEEGLQGARFDEIDISVNLVIVANAEVGDAAKLMCVRHFRLRLAQHQHSEFPCLPVVAGKLFDQSVGIHLRLLSGIGIALGFRRLFLGRLAALHQAGRLSFFGNDAQLAGAQSFAALLAASRKTEWVVYAKRPFGGPQAVLAYLSRYTHRVAIANSRLIALDQHDVTFR